MFLNTMPTDSKLKIPAHHSASTFCTLEAGGQITVNFFSTSWLFLCKCCQTSQWAEDVFRNQVLEACDKTRERVNLKKNPVKA